ncbi:MAG: DUF1566 domain-containing protein [Pseudomonadota bacterium]
MGISMQRCLLCCAVFLIFPASVFAGPVPDTGQTKCYNNSIAFPCPSPGQPFYGQDANYAINPRSYKKLDISGSTLPDSATSWVMVKDDVTGLVWEEKQNMDNAVNYANPHDADNTYAWYNSNPNTNGGNTGNAGSGANTENFLKALNDAHFGGYSDWRLPSIKELTELANRDAFNPSINKDYFPNTKSLSDWSESFGYWSSNTYAWNTSQAWVMNFSYSNGNPADKSTANRFVRAVRGGKSVPLDRYVVNDSTVTDTFTGLIWQQNPSDKTMTWEEALAYCKGLSLAGNTDWRLPDINELNSLVDYNRYIPSIKPANFSIDSNARYWSSTSLAYETDKAWHVSFDYGILSDAKSTKLNVHAVREGQASTTKPYYLDFSTRPWSEIRIDNIEKIVCTDNDLRKLITVLKSTSPPSGVLTFYSSIYYFKSPEDASWFFSQKDILNRNRFIKWESGERIKGQSTDAFSSNGSWENDAFKQFFEINPVYQCSGFANSGYYFLFGFAPDGDLNQFQGAAFTFVP